MEIKGKLSNSIEKVKEWVLNNFSGFNDFDHINHVYDLDHLDNKMIEHNNISDVTNIKQITEITEKVKHTKTEKYIYLDKYIEEDPDMIRTRSVASGLNNLEEVPPLYLFDDSIMDEVEKSTEIANDVIDQWFKDNTSLLQKFPYVQSIVIDYPTDNFDDNLRKYYTDLYFRSMHRFKHFKDFLDDQISCMISHTLSTFTYYNNTANNMVYLNSFPLNDNFSNIIFQMVKKIDNLKISNKSHSPIGLYIHIDSIQEYPEIYNYVMNMFKSRSKKNMARLFIRTVFDLSKDMGNDVDERSFIDSIRKWISVEKIPFREIYHKSYIQLLIESS